MVSPTWNILIATLGQREDRFKRLLSTLMPQVAQAQGAVHVTALWNNQERPISHVRQDLINNAVGTYVSFVDDDDELPEYYVDKILPLLDGVDYIGWRMQCIADGVKLNPTFHSLRYHSWFHDDVGYYRHVSHLNPIRLDLARRVSYRDCPLPEDTSWAHKVRPFVKSEHFIDDVMYIYHASSTDTTWRLDDVMRQRRHRRHQRRMPYVRPIINYPYFAYHPWSAT